MELPVQDAATHEASGSPRYPRAYRNLMVASLLGSIYRQHEDAEVASTAVEATLPDPTRYHMYRAIAKGIGGDSSFAGALLDKHIESHPDDDRAKVTLAVAMMLAGNPDWKPIIDRVLALSTDTAARKAAINLLDYLRNLRRTH